MTKKLTLVLHWRTNLSPDVFWSARMIRARQEELQGFGGISFSWLNCLWLYSMQFAFGAWIVFVDTWAYQGDKSLGQRCRCVNMPEWQFRGYLNINHCVDCVLWNPLKNWCDFEAQVLPHAITRFAGELVLEMMPSSPGDEPMSFHPSDKNSNERGTAMRDQVFVLLGEDLKMVTCSREVTQDSLGARREASSAMESACSEDTRSHVAVKS